MTNEENRQRDEDARDRDETARGRDELARNRDDFSQKATQSARTVQTWASLILILLVVGLAWLVNQEKEAIETMQESAVRTEEAAVATESVLRNILAEEQTPESQAFNEAVRRALRDIAEIKEILCTVEEPPEPCESP